MIQSYISQYFFLMTELVAQTGRNGVKEGFYCEKSSDVR
jgi:hypothetical protein